jgi:heat shock protein HtpX
MYEHITSNKVKSGFLIAFFVVLVVVVGVVFSYMFDLGFIGPIAAFVIVVGMTVTSYWYSDRIVLSMSRARPVDKAREPYLVNVIEGLSIAAGLPMPRAYVIDDPAPNAFATGRNPDNAAIAVTTGLMEKLNRLELEGVVAHELAHIKNYDTLVQTLAAVMAGTIVLVSDWMLRAFFWGGGRRRGGGSWIIMLIGIALMILAPFFAMIIQMAISRSREFLADANGALLTRYPQGLADALKKISTDTNQLRAANKATESLYIYNPLKDIREGKGLNALFNTHPPTGERIERLEGM